jgi:hypothetical protein
MVGVIHRPRLPRGTGAENPFAASAINTNPADLRQHLLGRRYC